MTNRLRSGCYPAGRHLEPGPPRSQSGPGGSYRVAFLNGLAWNLLDLAIAFWLFRAGRPRPAMA